jgi:hypothetical protein
VVIVFRLAYALAVAIFFILLAVFGQRTFISEPDFPFALQPLRGQDDLYCSESGCFRQGIELDEADDDKLSEEDLRYVRTFRAYQDDREDYSRNVFVISASLGVMAIAVGVYLFRRVEALPLGLVLGGIGVALHGWVESSRGESEMEESYAFIVAAIGFVVLAAGGYWFLGVREQRASPSEPGQPPQSEGQ